MAENDRNPQWRSLGQNYLFWVGVIVPILLWQVVSSLKLISNVFISSPVQVIGALISDIGNGILLEAVGVTLFRAITGFLLGSVLGVLAGLCLGVYKRAFKVFLPSIEFLRSIPVLSIFPLFLLFFGIGNTSKVMIAAWSSFFIVLIPTVYGVAHIPQIKITTAELFGASKGQRFFNVILPAALPEMLAGLRLGISIALIAVVVTEMFTGTKTGIGKYIYDAGLIYETSKMYAGIMVGGAMGLTINKIFLSFETKYVHWKTKI
jgi:ABC-type nitrate/sulfonate/bicarbonate transport system permease component